jgi:hypothetical protein
MPDFRLATPLCLAALLLVACGQKPGPADALVASVAKSAGECKDAVRALGGAMENSMDANVVAAARDTCNASSAAIYELSAPPETPPEQAELFATSLRDCAQAQSNIAELLGMAINRRGATEDDRARSNRVAGRDQSDACLAGLDAALAAGGGKLSHADKVRLTIDMPGAF